MAETKIFVKPVQQCGPALTCRRVDFLVNESQSASVVRSYLDVSCVECGAGVGELCKNLAPGFSCRARLQAFQRERDDEWRQSQRVNVGPTDVSCPNCGALPGRPCKPPTHGGAFHAQRIVAAKSKRPYR
jgi:hypothetical protein